MGAAIRHERGTRGLFRLARRYHRPVIRSWPLLAIPLIAGGLFAGCSPTPVSSKSSSLFPATSGNLPANVTSVTATLEPYNPQFANQGIPAEQVNFTVSSVTGCFSCKIDVVRSGRIVGTTTAKMGPPLGGSGSVTETVPVYGIKGGTFAGNPSNAHVACRAT